VRLGRSSSRGQQWKFDRFQNDYNVDRPQEALDDEPPASLWRPSPRSYPARLEAPEYPRHFELLRVSNAGHFKKGAQHYFISHALKGDYIGLEAIDDGLWNILYYKTLLGPTQRADRQDQRGFVSLGRVLTMSPDTCKGSRLLTPDVRRHVWRGATVTGIDRSRNLREHPRHADL
jgi:hypothetical protein